ncbi:MAG TPA: VCBS repeat-containing protein [Blastocatellia bacterium]|nr:VCBS repeat-containing protein [Blastocatellia bacterium]
MSFARTRLPKILLAAVVVSAGGAIVYFHFWNARYARLLDFGSEIDSFLGVYSKDFASMNVKMLIGSYSDGAVADFFSSQSAPAEIDGVKKITYMAAPGGLSGSVSEQVKRYFDQVDQVTKAKFKLNRVYDYEFNKYANVRTRFQVWGVLKDGNGFYDSGLLSMRIVKSDDADWTITNQKVEEASRILRPNRTYFTDATAASGLDTHLGNLSELNARLKDYRFSIISHLCRGAAVADVDGDGSLDVIVSGIDRVALYINDGRGHFTDESEKWGLTPSLTSNGFFPLFADVDNDGKPDLLLLRQFGDSKLFRNTGCAFEDVTERTGLQISPYAMTASFADYDGDGKLDLFIGCYGDTKNDVPETVVRSRNGKPAQLFRNLGGWKFEDTTSRAGIHHTGWALASMFYDLDGNGYPDIYIADDFGYSCLYTNNGDGTFRDSTWKLGTHNFSSDMNVSLLDFDGDGKLDIYTTGIAANTVWFQGPGMDYILGRFLTNPSTFAQTLATFADLGTHASFGELNSIGYKVNNGNSLMKRDDTGHYHHVEDETGTAWGEWSFGADVGDFDNDCNSDIFVANGFITAPNADDF